MGHSQTTLKARGRGVHGTSTLLNEYHKSYQVVSKAVNCAGEERGVKRTHCDNVGTQQPEVQQEEAAEEDFSDINTALAHSLSKIKRILR